jgi:DNA repair protein RadC
MNKDQFWDDLKSGKFVSMVKESSKGQYLNSSKEAYNMLKPLFAEEDDVEKMYFIFMNQRNEIIAVESLFKGSIARSAVYPREIVKRIIQLKANMLVMAHNHPSGDPCPSKEDTSITFKTLIAMTSIDVGLHDHLIIGDRYISMADEGIIKSMKNQLNSFIKEV